MRKASNLTALVFASWRQAVPRILPAKRLTADGLAIVTLGVLSHNDPQIQFIVSSFSGEDFVARGNLYQFGDTVVTHNPSCPTATVAEVASSVVEVVIGKDCPWWSVAAVDALAAVAKLDVSIKVREAIIGQWNRDHSVRAECLPIVSMQLISMGISVFVTTC